ncbi:MAG: gamma-glutamylcyclotransferase [Silicimonas sp.]|nr:gamma-glutamylcyclotransferase [Silicimonas sp.]
MSEPHFFGYGSLVNRATHGYDAAHPAAIDGWRRCWRHIAALDHAFLTAVPAPGHRINGLIAAVPGADWAALDEREMFYERIPAQDVDHPLERAAVEIYHAPEALNAPAEGLMPIHLSYLDVVVQGYLREFGEAGVADFFATTDGWEAPVLDDRAAPRYPRHQVLSRAERALSDHWIGRLGISLVALPEG